MSWDGERLGGGGGTVLIDDNWVDFVFVLGLATMPLGPS
jgi:hypothetical protein